jgi:hypothetical protein
MQITHEGNPGPNGQPLELTDVNGKPRCVPGDDINEVLTEHCANFAAPHSSSSSEVTRLELERQLSVSLAAQSELDHRIAQLTNELALKSASLEQAEMNAVEAARRVGPELREDADDRRLMRTSLVEQRDVEPVDMRARLMDIQASLDELLLSHDQRIGQYEKELAIARAKLEAKESGLEPVRLQAEKDLTEKMAEANTSRAAGSENEDEGVTRWLVERVQALEVKLESNQRNEIDHNE